MDRTFQRLVDRSSPLGNNARKYLRTVERNGGLDAFLTGTPDRKLPSDARRLKRRILAAQEKAGTTPAEAVVAEAAAPDAE